MKLKNIAIALTLTALSAQLSAQQIYSAVGGNIMRMSDFGIDKMQLFSQYDYSFGTPRSAAMGGAFASLGADLSSMAINPAGLGMYRASEFGFSPSITWTKTSQQADLDPYASDPSQTTFTRFTINNIGVAFNTFQGAGGTTSVTFGVGYQKLADFNYNSSITVYDQAWSINDAYARQVDGMDVYNLSSDNKPFWNLNPGFWGAATAYQSYAIDTKAGSSNTYRALLEDGIRNNSTIDLQTRGSIGEYNISTGINFQNRFYMGFSLGIQDIYYHQDSYYDEYYIYPGGASDPTPGLNNIVNQQYTEYEGTGVNFKFGMIFRPVDQLRIGVAVHTPTFAYLNSLYGIHYWTDLSNMPDDDYNGPHDSGSYPDDDVYRYSFMSPTRLMAGVSYQIGNVAILSADYEKVFYNGMRITSNGDYDVSQGVKDDYKADVKYSFRAANNLRGGIELKPTPELSLRAGYAFSGKVISDNDLVVPSRNTAVSRVHNPIANKVQNFSAGVGYRFGQIALDAVYVYSKTDYTDYTPFWYDDIDDNHIYGNNISSTMKRQMITLALSVRF